MSAATAEKASETASRARDVVFMTLSSWSVLADDVIVPIIPKTAVRAARWSMTVPAGILKPTAVAACLPAGNGGPGGRWPMTVPAGDNYRAPARFHQSPRGCRVTAGDGRTRGWFLRTPA